MKYIATKSSACLRSGRFDRSPSKERSHRQPSDTFRGPADPSDDGAKSEGKTGAVTGKPPFRSIARSIGFISVSKLHGSMHRNGDSLLYAPLDWQGETEPSAAAFTPYSLCGDGRTILIQRLSLACPGREVCLLHLFQSASQRLYHTMAVFFCQTLADRIRLQY